MRCRSKSNRLFILGSHLNVLREFAWLLAFRFFRYEWYLKSREWNGPGKMLRVGLALHCLARLLYRSLTGNRGGLRSLDRM